MKLNNSIQYAKLANQTASEAIRKWAISGMYDHMKPVTPTKSQQAKAFKSFAAPESETARPVLKYKSLREDGRYAACNGFIAALVPKELEIDKEVINLPEDAGCYINIEACIPNAKNQVMIPELADLMLLNQFSTAKDKHGNSLLITKISDGSVIGFNIKHLIAARTLCPNALFYGTDSIHPITAQENGITVMVCAVRLMENNTINFALPKNEAPEPVPAKEFERFFEEVYTA